MSGVYEQEFKLKASDTDLWRRLRLSVLFRMFQDISIAHTEALGAGRQKTLDRGALWVVTHMRLSVSRMPCYDEEIILKSWPGETMHVIFPRYYQIETKSGEVLVRGSSLWLLINRNGRGMVFPERLGVDIEGVRLGTEIPAPESLASPSELPETAERIVHYSETDLNGHMNNTRYLDWMDDLFSVDFHRSHMIRDLQINFVSEAAAGQAVELHWLLDSDTLFVKGCSKGFSMDCSGKKEKEKVIFAVRATFGY